ncbi:MAG: c-type cytochrome, partial [Burkholderiales bacterium]
MQRWIRLEQLPKSAVPGAELFESTGCTACHTYAGSGSRVLGAPDLTAIGTRKFGFRFQIAHLECPSCV